MRKLLLVLFLFLILNACGPKYFSCIDMTNNLNADDLSVFTLLDSIECAKYYKEISIKEGDSSLIDNTSPDDIDMWKSPERQ